MSRLPTPTASGKTRKEEPLLPGQAVLVMQSGGALGAFQAGVYEGMHEAGIEPDRILGTSIGAIIAGNAPTNRLDRLREFWELVASAQSSHAPWSAFWLGNLIHNLGAVSSGIPGFFTPTLRALYGSEMPLGVTDASFYTTTPLRHTLERLVDFERLAKASNLLTLGAVNVGSGQMRYFDNRQDSVGIDHVMASGALPPAFAAAMIDGEPHWDGGVYSNTPIEVVMDDNPRRDSVIFAAQLWQQQDDLPDTIDKVISRLKDIQYKSAGRLPG